MHILIRAVLTISIVWFTLTISVFTETLSGNNNRNSPQQKFFERSDETDKTIENEANTQAIWDAYWKAYPEHAWDATPGYSQDSYGGCYGS